MSFDVSKLIIAFLSMTVVTAQEAPAEKLLNQKRPLVIAHRGYSMIAPENSIPAFQFAVTAGADLVELDYHHSSDGVPIIMHDYELDRTTDAVKRWGGKKIRVDSKTAAELTTLDNGSWFKIPFSNSKVHTLSDALDCIQSNGVTLIERKAGDAATCIKILQEKNLINQLVVQAFDWNYLADFHKQEPRQVLGALGPPSTVDGRRLTDEEKQLSPKWISMVKKTGAKAVVWSRAINPEAVADAHSKGLKVWVYTINDPALAENLLSMGIDGIITDNPSIIFRTLARR